MMMARLMLVVLLSGVVLSSVSAQELTVVTEDWPPYNFKQEETITGISTEIVRATLNKAGIKAKIRLYPWARAYKKALEEENILIYTIIKTSEREELFHWVGPILPPIKEFLYKLKNRHDIEIQSLEEAKQYKVGAWRDDAFHHYLLREGFEEGKNLFPETNNIQNIEKLFRGRIDLLAASEVSLPFRMKELGLSLSEVERTVPLLNESPIELYMALSRNTSDDLVEQVQTAFEQIRLEGIIEIILEKYMESD